MSEKNWGFVILVLTAFLYGLGGVCVKSITWSALSINCIRSLISLFIFVIYKKSFRIEFSKTNLLGAAFMAASSVFYMLANKLTTAGTTIVLEYIAPILVFLFEVIFRKRKVVLFEALLTLMVFIGCVLSFADNIDMSHILGNIFAIMSGFAYAGQLIVLASNNSNGQDVSIIGNLMSFLFSLPFFLTDAKLSFDYVNIIWILILSIFQYGMANLLLSIGMKKVEKVKASLILTLEPIINPILVYFINGEAMGKLAILGSIIVIVSISVYSIISSDKIETIKES